MKNSYNKIILWCSIGFILLFLSGCANLQKPTETEKQEVAKIETVEKIYRPKEQKPPLPVLGPKSELKDFVIYAIYNNPKIEEAFYEWEKAVEIIPAYRYAPNLQISLQMQISSQIDYFLPGLMITYPAKDKLYFSAETTALEAKKKWYAFQQEILKTAFDVKNIGYQYWVTKKKIELTKDTINTLDEMENISLAKVKTGSSSLADVLNIQMEKEKFKNILADLNDYSNVLKIQFAKSLGINAYDSKEPIPEPPLNLTFTENGFDEKEIWETVKEKNPRLALMKTGIEQAQDYIKLAYADYKPDFGFSLQQTIFSNMNFAWLTPTLSIPWRGKVAAEIASSNSGEKMAQAEFSSEELESAAMLADGFFRWRQANREYTLYKDSLIPRIKAVMGIAMDSYKAGNSGIEGFLNAQKTYFDFSTDCFSSMGMREITLNEISLIIAGITPENIF